MTKNQNTRSEEARIGEWFLEKVLRKLVKKFQRKVYMETRITKPELYRWGSWTFRFSKRDTRRTLTRMAQTFDDIQFSNRGLWIPRKYLSILRTGKLPSETDSDVVDATQEPDTTKAAAETTGG